MSATRSRKAKNKKKKDDRRCKRCVRGRIERSGEAEDGRPRYRCPLCDYTYTHGKDGEAWDDASRKALDGFPTTN